MNPLFLQGFIENIKTINDMNKRLLILMASLLLCGTLSAQNWGTPDSHAQPSNTPIVASVTIDGEAVTASDALRLGAFVGDELRGIAAQHDDENFWIQVFYTDENDDITFKFYDGANEYTTCATILAGSEEGYGTPSVPQVLNFTSVQPITQTTTLVTGWNWWSTPIEMNDIDGLTMLEDALGNTGIRIQSKSSYVDYIEFQGMSFWDGELAEITNEQMYKIRTNVGSTITLNGNTAIPSNHTITISKGWNWIGFPSGSSISLEDAFASFTPENEDVIKSKGSYSQYIVFGDFAFWDGDLTTLIPGQGYMYQSSSNNVKQLTFQNGNRNEAVVENGSLSGKTFLTNGDDFANNMTITAQVELDGEILRSDNYELAAFVGNECRGSVMLKYVEPLDQYYAFLLVHGDDVESLRFVLTNGKECSWSKDYLMYTSDASIGAPTQPVVLHFGPMGVNEDDLTMINVYPNPSNDVFNIECEGIQKVDVINSFGQVIYTKELKENFIQIDLSSHAIGAYLIRIVTNKGVFSQQIIKK